MFRISLYRHSVSFSFLRSPAFAIDRNATTLHENNTKSENINEDILKNIVCPLTKKQLRYDSQRQLLINDELAIGYKIKNGIPNMIPTEAIKLDKS